MVVATSDGNVYETEFDSYLADLKIRYPKSKEGNLPTDTLLHETEDTNSMPSAASGKPTGAFKSEIGTGVAPTFDSDQTPDVEAAMSQAPIIKGLSNIAEGLINVVKIPGDTYKGKFTTEEITDRGIELGTSVGVLSSPFAAFKPGLGMFGGRMTKEAVSTASHMERLGMSDISIKEMTGLERGADGMWRREFSDAGTKFTFKNGKLEDVWDHPELYKIYPEAKDIKVVKKDRISPVEEDPDNLVLGNWDMDNKRINISSKVSADEAKSITAHEVQHFIQELEGFAPGGNMQSVVNPLRDQLKGHFLRNYAEEPLNHIADLIQANRLDEARTIAKKLLDKADFRVYSSIMGEVEARNTQRRLDWVPRQRKQLLGRETEDIPGKEQVYLTK